MGSVIKLPGRGLLGLDLGGGFSRCLCPGCRPFGRELVQALLLGLDLGEPVALRFLGLGLCCANHLADALGKFGLRLFGGGQLCLCGCDLGRDIGQLGPCCRRLLALRDGMHQSRPDRRFDASAVHVPSDAGRRHRLTEFQFPARLRFSDFVNESNEPVLLLV